MSQAGIYQILNLVNQKSYIGSSECIKQRLYHHRRNLRISKHTNTHLQSSWNKYGEHNFITRTLEIVENPTQKLLEERENYWINYYNSTNEGRGYNKQKADRGTFTEEWKKLRKEINSKIYTEKYFNNLKCLSDLSQDKKDLLVQNLLKYTLKQFSIKLKRNTKTLKIFISNQYEEKTIYILLEPLTVISEEEYKKINEPIAEKIYRIELNSSKIVETFAQFKEVILSYPDINPKYLEQVLYSNNNKCSVNNMIFVLESKYNSNELYSIRKGKVKQVEEIDNQGNVIKLYSSPNHLIELNPNLSIQTLRGVLANKCPSTMYPFRYKGLDTTELRDSGQVTSTPSVIYELNESNEIIKEFKGLNSIITQYPDIKKKDLEKVLYTNRKSTKGHYFVLERNYMVTSPSNEKRYSK